MRRTLFSSLSILGPAVGLCLAGVTAVEPASAAEWHRPAAGAAVEVTQSADAAVAADDYLHLERGALGLESVELLRTRMLSSSGHDTLRYVQRYAGLPVIGGQAAVRIGADGRVRAAVLEVERGIDVSPVPSIEAPQAKAIVAELLSASPKTLKASLAVWPNGRGGRLCWQVDIPTIEGGRRALVDAQDGTIFQLRPVGLHALGRVYPISSVVSPATQDLELTDLVVTTPQYLTGFDGNLVVTNYVSGSAQSGDFVVEQTVEPNSGEDFLYDPPADASDATDAFAQVMIYYHLTRMHDFFSSGLGLDMSAASWELVAAANLQDGGQPLNNAFFSDMGIQGDHAAPNLIGIGQGTIDFSQDSDVFNHEFTHYVTNNAVGFNATQLHSTSFGLSPFSGGIDEGLSDYFACTVNDDPILGEASLALIAGGASRDLTDTSKACPDDIIGEVHADGEIAGSLAWTLRASLGAAKADQLVWDATTLLTFGATFGDFGRALQQAADDLLTDGVIDATERQLVDDEIEARGLHECDPVVPIRKEEPRTANLFGLDILAQFFGGSCTDVKTFGAELQSFFHFRVTPEADDERVRFSVDMQPQGGNDLSWKVYAAIDDHVAFQPSMFLPEVADFDYVSEAFTGAEGELVIDELSDPPFDPSSTYTFVIVHQNCPVAIATLSTDADDPTGGAGGGGTGGGGPGGGGTGGVGGGNDATGDQVIDDGCGCRLAGDAPGSSWPAWLALGLGVAIWRRRRG